MALHSRLLLGTATHLFSLPWWKLSLEGDLCQSRAFLKESYCLGEVLTPRVLRCHCGWNPVFSHTHKVRYDLFRMRKESKGYLELAFLLCAEWEP